MLNQPEHTLFLKKTIYTVEDDLAVGNTKSRIKITVLSKERNLLIEQPWGFPRNSTVLVFIMNNVVNVLKMHFIFCLKLLLIHFSSNFFLYGNHFNFGVNILFFWSKCIIFSEWQNTHSFFGVNVFYSWSGKKFRSKSN